MRDAKTWNWSDELALAIVVGMTAVLAGMLTAHWFGV